MNLPTILRGFAFLVLLVGMLTILLMYIVIVMVDWLQWLPFPDGVMAENWPQLLMIYLFREAGPVEQIQFRLLFAASGLALLLLLTAIERRAGRALILGFGFLTFGLVLMYINDAYNFRHWMTREAAMWFYGPIFEHRNALRIILELGFYAFLASFMVAFAVLFWPQRRRFVKSQWVLVSAYVCYFFASVASATRYIGSWYDRAGGVLADFLPEHMRDEMGRLPFIPEYPYYFWLMDWVIEETIEYVGALCFVVALLFLLSELLSIKNPNHGNEGK